MDVKVESSVDSNDIIKVEDDLTLNKPKSETLTDCETDDVKIELKTENEDSSEKVVNLYSYIDQDYTSEIFKIEVRNLPQRVNHATFHKFLHKNDIEFRKAKVIPANKFKSEKASHAYVTLKSAEDRTNAIAKLDNIKFKGAILSAQESRPLPDPLLIKRRDNAENRGNKRQRTNENFKSKNDKSKEISKATIDDNFDILPEEKRIEIINSQVASLWNVPYDDQLSQKATLLQKVMKTCFYDFRKICNDFPKTNENRLEVKPTLDWFGNVQIEGLVIGSPVVNGYRNKCEFSIGSDRVVGFRLGLYKEGTIKVVNPPDNCPIISEQMNQILRHFQQYLTEKTTLAGFDPVTHEGYWRQIMVRTTRAKQGLISIAFHRQQFSDEQVEKEVIEPIKLHFADNSCGVCSIYFQVINDRSSQVSKAEPKLVHGENHVYEKLMNDSLQFRISPLSFFQVNTDAAELLYGKIVELAACKPETTVLDICCGTGTIGLCFARSVRKVIGLELNEDAIKDARFNAQLNQITNIEFYCGRAEQLISQILNNLGPQDGDVVAVLDPPRSGLPASLIKSVRNNEKINRLVYVSCEANAARRNFLDLCRPRSKAYHGRPFVPRKAIPVDMFPHTDRCELILLFERI